jgi:hypothetical protein
MESKAADPDSSESVYLNPTGRDRPYYYRTNDSDGNDITPSGIKAGLANGFWYGFSVCIPSASLLAEDTTTFHRICQIHTDQDSGTGEIGRYPLFSIKLTKSSVWQWSIQHFSSENRTQLTHSTYNNGSASLVSGVWTWTPSAGYGSGGVEKGVADIPALGDLNADRGLWVNWVINAAFDWRNLSPAGGSKGKLDLWKSGVLVYQYRGPLGFNDQYGPYFKMGYYTGQTWSTPRTIYHDSYRYADPANGSYAAVSPR